MRTSIIALITAAALLMPTMAVAQQPIDGMSADVTAENAETVEDQVSSPTSREEAPNTDSCPNQTSPEQARTTSEAVAPGDDSPTPLPVSATPAGGSLMSSCGIIAPEGFELPDNLTASSWMVFDIDSGEIMASKDPHGRYRPASIIKVLLGLVAIDELDPATKVNGTWDAANIEGSRVGVGEDGEYSVDQLLHGLLLASGNDAAYLLAQELGGDEQTLAKVNALAKKLGTQDTYAATYSGLDAPGMSTSAYDMSLIYQHAWQNPTFAQIIETEFIDFPGWGDNEGFQVWNDNSLFMNDPDGIGGKTGYTDDANHTFVGGLNRDGRRLAAVVLDTTVDKGRPWEQARTLIDASLAVSPAASVGALGELSAQASAEATPLPETTASPAQGAQESTEIDVLKVALPIGAIVLLLLAALAFTFRKGRRR